MVYKKSTVIMNLAFLIVLSLCTDFVSDGVSSKKISTREENCNAYELKDFQVKNPRYKNDA